MSDDDFLSADLSWIDGDTTIENTKELASRRLIRKAEKRSMISATKREKAAAIAIMPQPGESVHIIGNGRFDYWSFIPIYCRMLGNTALEFYGSTWTLNRENAIEMMDLFDSGALASISMATGIYFKRRETSVYAFLVDGLLRRKQRYVAFKNHTKVSLLTNGVDYIVIEGSANYTANPNLEQYVITNDQALYEFHRQWMNEMYQP